MSQDRQCIFCITDPKAGVGGDPTDRVLTGYEYWWLILQPKAKRAQTKQAAGMLIPKRHIEALSSLKPAEATELLDVYKDGARRLCEDVGVTYTNQETVGFNEGTEAGQTVDHAHVHIFPVAKEDPEPLKVRSGIGGAFEALRAARLG
jgi:diadenosine tetraphosphate (Ap4A) HIT family hydrolase